MDTYDDIFTLKRGTTVELRDGTRHRIARLQFLTQFDDLLLPITDPLEQADKVHMVAVTLDSGHPIRAFGDGLDAVLTRLMDYITVVETRLVSERSDSLSEALFGD